MECPVCGKKFKTYSGLLRHVRSKHPDKFEDVKNMVKLAKMSPPPSAAVPDNVNTVKVNDGETDSITFLGITIKVGDTIKAIYGRYAWYIKVVKLLENPTIIIGEDVYGHPVMLKLTKTTMIMKLNEGEFEQLSRRARRRRGEKT